MGLNPYPLLCQRALSPQPTVSRIFQILRSVLPWSKSNIGIRATLVDFDKNSTPLASPTPNDGVAENTATAEIPVQSPRYLTGTGARRTKPREVGS